MEIEIDIDQESTSKTALSRLIITIMYRMKRGGEKCVEAKLKP